MAKQAESYNPSYVYVRATHGKDGRAINTALTRRELTAAFVARFHSKYQKAPNCWLWTAGKFAKGYGMVNLGRWADGSQHTTYAHRVAYVLTHGDIPQGAVVMHSCDVPACVNPAHLSLGTQADNLQDASRKGRLPKTRLSLRRLSDADVTAIRSSTLTGAALARRLKVSAVTISLIRRGLRRVA